jgi:hypothetical protein
MSNKSSEQLLKEHAKWLDVEGIAPLKDKKIRMSTAQMIENFINDRSCHNPVKMLSEAAPANNLGGFPNAGPVRGYDPVVISMIRRAAPNLIAYDICGVQTMQASTGLIFAKRATYSTQGGAEALFNEADTDFTGTGTHAGSDPFDPASTFGTAMSRAAGEALGTVGSPVYNELAFTISKVTVTAGTRALKTQTTPEMIQDMQNHHGINLMEELHSDMSMEIAAETNREIVRTVGFSAVLGAQQPGLAVAGEFDLDVDVPTSNLLFSERFKGLMFQIEREANQIAKSTRRGKGNIIITTADVASALSMAGLLDVGSNLKNNLIVDDTGNTFAGVLNGQYKVFVDPYAGLANWLVVGYKGSSLFDAGLFYAPYIPLYSYSTVEPGSGNPILGYKSRYGVVANPFATTAGDGAITAGTNVYYRKFKILNLV